MSRTDFDLGRRDGSFDDTEDPTVEGSGGEPGSSIFSQSDLGTQREYEGVGGPVVSDHEGAGLYGESRHRRELGTTGRDGVRGQDRPDLTPRRRTDRKD